MSSFPRHFDGKRFYNLDAPQAPGFFELLRWKFSSRTERSPSFVCDVEQSVPARHVEGNGLRVTLVNHSTVLIQGRDFNILTDPMWSERASPFSWAGPRRRRKPGVSSGNLPRIDAVVISHNHYDHLDLPTLRWLAMRGDSTFIVPLRQAKLLRSQKLEPVRELDWGESIALESLTVHCVPAVHFSSRAIFDRNRTLWCGYVIETAERVIYFAGDTAFGNHFADIRERFGAPDLALLPIGAYEPRWFMSRVHMAPDEALQAHDILGARASIAIHHGTFQLADEALDAPREQLTSCGKPDRFLVLRNGESIDLRG